MNKTLLLLAALCVTPACKAEPEPAATESTAPAKIDIPQVRDMRKTIQFPHPVPDDVRKSATDAVTTAPSSEK